MRHAPLPSNSSPRGSSLQFDYEYLAPLENPLIFVDNQSRRHRQFMRAPESALAGTRLANNGVGLFIAKVSEGDATSMIFDNKRVISIAMATALLGGTVGAFISRSGKSTETASTQAAAPATTAQTTQPATTPAPAATTTTDQLA